MPGASAGRTSKVLVDDGQTIVLGGLIEDRIALAVNKVPLLGDIPWLGGFFRYETRDQQDQPDGFPAPGRAARCQVERRAVVRAL